MASFHLITSLKASSPNTVNILRSGLQRMNYGGYNSAHDSMVFER